jgi:LuxR family transcriptional regulator, maltose regulon positive regulatory protein
MVEILSTKLFIPRPRINLISRPRLINRLNAGLDKKLTLIAAPAGFGKTTLLSEWIPRSPHCVTWLSLDEGDNSPSRFWMYFVAALQTLSPELGRGAQALSPSLQPHDIESILTMLINEINAFGDSFVHVFDDYHFIDSTEIDYELAYLIDHQPSNLHLIIASRENPHLPLARLRARDQFTELRASDLRFTSSEAAGFLHAMSLELSAEDIHALEDRTEGWIAGLQLAALSIQGNKDVSGFIREFAGDHRYIVDYLIEEVLQRQPECVRSFLLQTSILERLNGPLCDAVTDQVDCNVLLEDLERGNYFVIPLDDKRHWYRYHHLFGEVLRMHLMTERPDQVPILHRRASDWYEQNGSAPDAIRHALAGGDFERAAGLIELAFAEMSRSRQEATLLGWLRALPEELVRDRPVLCNIYAGTLLQSGEMEGVDVWLQAAERWLAQMHEGQERPDIPLAVMVVEDQEEFRRLPGAVAIHRAGHALMLGNVNETVKHARRALDLAPEDDFLRRGGAAALQGLALWRIGDLEAARQMYLDGIVCLRRAGYMADSTGAALALADIVIAQGRLHEAMGIYEQALRFASEHGEPNLRGTADMLVGMSELYLEQNDLETAAQYLHRSQEQGEHTGLPQNRHRWRVAMARILEAEGDLNGALDFLNVAERLYTGDFSPNVRPISALKARVWVEQGRLVEAIDWVHERKLSSKDDLSYLSEFEHITLARILLARYKRDGEDGSIREAIGLLERLLIAAEEGGRMRSAIEILVLQALARQASGDLSAALPPLQQALTLGEPEGYMRIFLDEGSCMAELLRKAAARRIMPEYTGKLLAAFAGGQHGEVAESPSPTPQSLIEPLSQRELEVLRLFNTELSGPEIARELVVALSTVRTHTKSIYSKLNVNDRRAAVKRAIELGLI